MKRILFMGTPFFAAEVLKHLLTFKELEVVGVVCQPDRKMSRKKKIVYSEVKEVALENNLPLFQPFKIGEISEDLKSLTPSAIVTCAYGQFLPQSILDLNVINVHASLLPKYRGGAPMQHAIFNNEKTTGITLMKSVLKMDAGPVYKEQSVSISPEDTLTSLELKLIDTAKELLSKQLIAIINHAIEPKEQNELEVTFAPTITKKDELITFNRDNIEVYNHIRGLIDNPYGYALLDGKRIKFTKVELGQSSTNFNDSFIDFQIPEYFEISTNNGTIKILECQIEGRQKQSVKDIFNGYRKLLDKRRLNDEN